MPRPRLNRTFDDTLNSLLARRIDWLKRKIWPHAGQPSHLTKSTVDREIAKIQNVVVEALSRDRSTKHIISRFDYKKQWHTKRGKPFRNTAKKKAFGEWYKENITARNCVYIFWQKRKCLYVGR